MQTFAPGFRFVPHFGHHLAVVVGRTIAFSTGNGCPQFVQTLAFNRFSEPQFEHRLRSIPVARTREKERPQWVQTLALGRLE